MSGKGPAGASGGAAVPGASRPQDGDVSPAKPVGPVAAAEPPLPSKEETERQIREEAARKQAEADHRVAQQEEDLQTLRDDDRSRFREDLRMVLQEYGKQAGKEIEELSVRAGRDDDPDRRAQAYRVLGMTAGHFATHQGPPAFANSGCSRGRHPRLPGQQLQ